MDNPFRIKTPALVSFSGGRTSGFMLWNIVQAYEGRLPDDLHVVFANTGKEVEQTLEFVHECETRWGVPVRWIEYHNQGKPAERFAICDYETASRAGEPFEAIIKAKRMVPNPSARFCTTELKVVPMSKYARSLGWQDWDVAVGLRADEAGRVARLRGQNTEGRNDWQYVMPLHAAGLTKQDVLSFWDEQGWGLRLPHYNGNTFLGNCDLCFLKTRTHLEAIVRANPDMAEWWARQEESIPRKPGKTNQFKPAIRPFREIINDVRMNRQPRLDLGDEVDMMLDCLCGDN